MPPLDFIRENPVAREFDRQESRRNAAADTELRREQTRAAMAERQQRTNEGNALGKAMGTMPAGGGDSEAMAAQMEQLVRSQGISPQTRLQLMSSIATLRSTQDQRRERRAERDEDRNFRAGESAADRAIRVDDIQARRAQTAVDRERQAQDNAQRRREARANLIARRLGQITGRNTLTGEVMQPTPQQQREAEAWADQQLGITAPGAPAASPTAQPAPAASPAASPAPTPGQRSDASGPMSDASDGMGTGERQMAQAVARSPSPASGAQPAAAPTPSARAPIGPSDRYVDTLFGYEGSGQNPRSTARGHGQFLEGTWLGRADAPGIAARLGVPREMLQRAWAGDQQARAQVLDMRNDRELARRGTLEYARIAGQTLIRAGLPVNDQTLALAHFLGPAGAARFLRAHAADPNAPITRAVSAPAYRSNPELLSRNGQPITTGDLFNLYQTRFGGGSAAPAASPAAAAPPTQVAAAGGATPTAPDVPPVPRGPNGAPDLARMRDGEQYRHADGRVGRYDASRRSLVIGQPAAPPATAQASAASPAAPTAAAPAATPATPAAPPAPRFGNVPPLDLSPAPRTGPTFQNPPELGSWLEGVRESLPSLNQPVTSAQADFSTPLTMPAPLPTESAAASVPSPGAREPAPAPLPPMPADVVNPMLPGEPQAAPGPLAAAPRVYEDREMGALPPLERMHESPAASTPAPYPQPIGPQATSFRAASAPPRRFDQGMADRRVGPPTPRAQQAAGPAPVPIPPLDPANPVIQQAVRLFRTLPANLQAQLRDMPPDQFIAWMQSRGQAQ